MHAQKKDVKKKAKKIQNRINKLEKEIMELERVKKLIDVDLANPDKFKELSNSAGFFEEYEKQQNRITELESQWQDAIEKLQEIRSGR